METAKSRRIHIGNISKKLAENTDSFIARLSKFGKVEGSIDLRTKPVNDFYYAFIDMEISDKQFESLKKSLNGVLFMGRKLTISVAKTDYMERWKKDAGRPETSKSVLMKHANIANARDKRISESRTTYPTNSITGAPLYSTSLPAPNNSSIGYACSPHTFNNTSANTKNKAPSHSLIGPKSYGSTLNPKGVATQQYSRTSGRAEVVKGRMRNTPRPAAYFVRKQQTMRILINGELKQIKCYKTKLWGVEKKAAVDLTYRFVNGAWRSGDDHIIERVEKVTTENRETITSLPEVEEESLVEEEKDKNKNVLASFFESYDFDKPIALEDDDKMDEDEAVTFDSKGRKNLELYDFEAKGVVSFDEESHTKASGGGESLQEFIQLHERPLEEVYFSEDDEGNELDVNTLGEQYATETIKEQYDKEHDIVESTEKPYQEPSNDENAATTNETEKLRSLFESNKPTNSLFTSDGEFKLGLDESDDDIDYEKEKADQEEQRKLAEQITLKQKEVAEDSSVAATSTKKFGLFWTHFDSPFLQTQTQLSKIGHANEKVVLPGEEEGAEVRDEGHGEEDAYERWFWLMRGEVSRDCKRRKRDVLRTLKKRHVRAVV